MSQAADERHYVRAVEAAWSRLLGKPSVVSPREFETIASWRRRGIPLSVVCEVIEAAGKRRSGRAPRALTALGPSVLEAWDVVAAGRATPCATTLPSAGDDARRAWQEAIARLPEGDRLRTLLATLLAQGAAGRTAEALDATLDASLASAISPETVRRLSEATARGVAPFRDRMSDDEFHGMFARALTDRLRAELRLPRLTLSR